MTKHLMSIREMSDLFNVTPRTLRFYEAKELLNPVKNGQTRWFTNKDRARLKLILQGKRFGFSLEEMRQLLNMYDEDETQFKQLTHTYRIALLRLEDMQRQRLELAESIDDLREEISWVSEKIAAKTLNMAPCYNSARKSQVNQASL